MPTMKIGQPESRKLLATRIREGREDVRERLRLERIYTPALVRPAWPELVADVVAHVLRNLGDTADEVAVELEKLGINGERRDCDECPIARLVYRMFPGIWAAAEPLELSLGDKDVEMRVMMPAQVTEFMERFDAGAFPALHDFTSLPGPGDEDDDEDDDFDDDDLDDQDDEMDEEDEDA